MVLRERQVLDRPWRRWLAENLARGVEPAALRERLRERAVPEREISRRLAEAAEAAALAVEALSRAARAEQALALRGALRAPEIERRTTPEAGEFFGCYWASGTPAIFVDLVTRWPAFGRWSAASLRERFGEVEVEAEIGRAGDPEPDIHYLAHRRRLRLADFIDQALAAGESDDLYMIARNHNLARPELRALLEEIEPPAGYFDEARLAGGAALWFGPAGTVTRLHHDCSNILFCQVVGQKRVRLGAPEDPALLSAARGVYSRIDPEAPSATEAAPRLYDVTLAAGEALFIPVGWWHHVRALELSISVALNAFSRPNCFDWYMPGRVE